MEGYWNVLIKKLQTEGLATETVTNFMLLTNNNSQKIQFSENLLKEHDLLPNYEEVKLEKCNEKAEEFRNLGNQLYKKKKFYEALVSYNKSLCYSPESSQNIGITFGNRSAVYFAMGQYGKCLENIELANNHNYSVDKIEKLKERKKKALENLNNCSASNQKLIKYEAARERYLKPKLKAKENLNFFVADCLEVKTSPEFGRHLITNEDLKVGSVIAVEKPFSKVLVSKVYYENCANCLGKNLLNLLPCFNCCSAMFCSEDCRSAAQEKFHKYECGLINAIDELFPKASRLTLRTYFEALHIFETPSKLKEFLKSIKDSNATILDFDNTDEASFQKNSLHSIDTLVTFEKHCDNADLFSISFSSACAIVCNLMLNYSEPLKALLVEDADQDFFREFIFKYSQISKVNAHSLYCMTPSTETDEDKIASAFYPFCALTNHSCVANVYRETFETSNCIIVCRPIKKGQQIFDNYGFHHTFKSREERQNELFDQYSFKCQCEACQNDNDYPLAHNLKIKNADLMKTLDRDFQYLQILRNLDFAVNNYEKYCKLMDELDKKYRPCFETTVLQELMAYCLRIFLKDEEY